MSYSAREKLAEIAMRKRVYPTEVQRGRLTREAADRQIAIMEAIAQDYRRPPAVGDLFGDAQ